MTKPKRKLSERQLDTPYVRPPAIRAFLDSIDGEIVVDNFAGGGGTSSGVAAAFGRDPDIAINHDATAIAVHKANHPTTQHFTEDVWQVDPAKACGGRPVGFAWFSPDCKHFSRAKGGKPKDQKIRGLAWVAIRWAKAVRPRVICLENVPEFKDWGPLYKDHSHGCKAGGARKRGQKAKHAKCRKLCRFGKPIPEKRGHTYRAWRRRLERMGYTCEERILKACDYGAPTSRTRYFFCARCDGQPIAWPEPTHGPGRAAPYRTAAECIDWSKPCPSIFARKKPLSKKTLARIARGLDKFVLSAASPFIIPVTHPDHRGYGMDDQVPTITAANRGELAIVAPHITKYYSASESGGAGQHQGTDAPLDTITAKDRFGVVEAVLAPHITKFQENSIGQDPRTPIDTIMAGATRFGVVSPLIVKAKTHGGGGNDAMSADEPLRTITTSPRGEFAIAVPYMVHRSNGERPGQAPRIYDIEKPIGTIVSQGLKHALCAAFLEKGYSEQEGGWNGGQAATKPIGTITQRDHHRAITVQLTPGNDNDEHRGMNLGRAQEVYAFMVKFAGTSDAHVASSAFSPDDQVPTITAGGGKGGGKLYVVTVTIAGEPYVVVDIGMRMLTPRELFNAQGFQPDYIIDPVGPKKKKITKTAQIKLVGNSVPPPFSEAMARANCPEMIRRAT